MGTSRKDRRSKLVDFAPLQRYYFATPEYRALSVGARALLIEFALKFTGRNNGNLEMTAEQAQQLGIGSAQTFQKYKVELINAGWIIVTRQGGLGNRCSLYALTYIGINNTGRLYDDARRADPMPLHLWKKENAHKRDERRVSKSRRRIETLTGSTARAEVHLQ